MYSSLLFFNNRSALPTKRQIGLEFSNITAAEYAKCFFTDSNCTTFVKDLQDKMVAFMNEARAEWLTAQADGAVKRREFVRDMARKKRDNLWSLLQAVNAK